MAGPENCKINFIDNGCRYYSMDSGCKTLFEKVAQLIAMHLSEPYSVYVYWYFFHQWPQYCILVSPEGEDKIIGVIISKVGLHNGVRMRGYIGMLVIDPAFRGRGMAKKLVKTSVAKMVEWDCVHEVTLETEVNNEAALHLYELFGFLRTKRLHRYYLTGSDAFRLILPLERELTIRVAYLPKRDDLVVGGMSLSDLSLEGDL